MSGALQPSAGAPFRQPSPPSPPPPPPAPPRRARWRSVAARRLWIGLVGLGLLLAGGLLLLPWAPSLPGAFEDVALDASSQQASGDVVDVVPEARLVAGRRFDLVRYRFHQGATGDAHVSGESWVAHPAPAAFTAGAPIRVEFLRDRPEVSRAFGTTRAPAAPRATLLVTVMLLGVALVAFWLRGALRLKVALTDGDQVAPQVTEVRLLRWLYPVLVRVRYRYRSEDGTEHAARQWTTAKSPLARGLFAGEGAAAIYDLRRPSLSRLVTADDFSE